MHKTRNTHFLWKSQNGIRRRRLWGNMRIRKAEHAKAILLSSADRPWYITMALLGIFFYLFFTITPIFKEDKVLKPQQGLHTPT